MSFNSDYGMPMDEADMSRRYLLIQGSILKWWIIANWIGLGMLACCSLCCCWVFKGIAQNTEQAVTRE